MLRCGQAGDQTNKSGLVSEQGWDSALLFSGSSVLLSPTHGFSLITQTWTNMQREPGEKATACPSEDPVPPFQYSRLICWPVDMAAVTFPVTGPAGAEKTDKSE